MFVGVSSFSATDWGALLAVLVFAYAIGAIPVAYIIVRLVTGEDITTHGTGNVGAMNVRRTTGSWVWFAVAMVGDALKGLVPVLMSLVVVARIETPATLPAVRYLIPEAAVLGAVLGHNYSVWMALIEKRFRRTGKGLSTGAGALLAYDWRYFVAVLVVGLIVIALTRYLLAGQVAAAITLPVASIVLQQPDWPFCLLGGALIYSAHHKRFMGLLQGKEPKLYINDRSGPRG